MKIKTEEYSIGYDTVTKTVTCQGKLRLAGMEEYAPLVQLLDDVIDEQSPMLTLDLEGLEFLNSSGINVFLKFVLKVRQQKNIQLVVQGSTSIPWQSKSLKNFQRLMPELQLELK